MDVDEVGLTRGSRMLERADSSVEGVSEVRSVAGRILLSTFRSANCFVIVGVGGWLILLLQLSMSSDISETDDSEEEELTCEGNARDSIESNGLTEQQQTNVVTWLTG